MIGEILTGAVSWAGTVVTFVTGQPLIMFFVVLGGIYIGVNLVRKLMRL